jgi:DNA-binding SARP family transcriptional activator
LHGRFETAVEEKRLTLGLLGPPKASLWGNSLRFRRKKILALFCYLATEGGRHPRRELAELLWPQSDERHARADLRAVLSKLRKSLGEESADDGVDGASFLLIIDGDLLGLEPEEVELDTEALEAAVSLARRGTSPATSNSAAGGRRRELIGRLREALGLYRGEFMEGFSVEGAPQFEL